jgi:Asp-tRNA(Asn)/Glu-tRNA(Gln) amidotransferase A subunit family amidase
LGKTVTAEFAYFAPGLTRNPYNLEHTPGGSSSGSAAAVASGLCPLALGTQTGGSILRPASFCGVIGFKPTYNRVSLEGVITNSPSVDHAGFFTGDLESARVVASMLCKDWTRMPKLPPLVLGVPEGRYLEKAGEESLGHFRRTCDRLANSGFVIRSVEMLRNIEQILEQLGMLVAAEAAITHKEWFSKYSDLYHEKTAELIRKGQSIGWRSLAKCRAGRKRLREELVSTMTFNDVSVLIAPAAVGPAPRGLEDTGDPVMNIPWSYAGLPTVSIPCGLSREGLPMGLQLIGSWMCDELLLDVSQKVARFLV